MAVLYAGSVSGQLSALPDPKHGGFTVRLQDIDASTSGRTADGTMIRDRVVGGANAKRKLEIEWPAMDSATASALLHAIADTFFYVQYPDPYTGMTRVGYFYAGDREDPVYSVNPTTGAVLWEGIKVNLIEQ